MLTVDDGTEVRRIGPTGHRVERDERASIAVSGRVLRHPGYGATDSVDMDLR